MEKIDEEGDSAPKTAWVKKEEKSVPREGIAGMKAGSHGIVEN